MSGDYLNSREYREQRQRERLRVAFVQAMADHGYEAMTVARVSELSGCSTETFHHHYEDLVACYRDTCSHSLQESRSATITAWLTVHGWSERLRRACHALLGHVEEHLDAARAVLFSPLAGDPDLADHVRDVVSFHERALVMGFQLHPQGFPTSRLTPRALTGGMRHALYLRMKQGREQQITVLADDLHDWIECHRSSAAARLPIEADAPPPAATKSHPTGDQPGLLATLALRCEDERSRVLETVAQLMLQAGRETLDDATVARFAGISAARFAADYSGVRECVVEIVDKLVEGNTAAMLDGLAQGRTWPESVRLALMQSVGHLRANRDLARLCVLRLPLVPGVAGARHAALADRIVSIALGSAPAPIHAPTLLPGALVGVVEELLIWALSAEAPGRLPALADQISFFLLAPHLGGEAAGEAVIACADGEWLGRRSEGG